MNKLLEWLMKTPCQRGKHNFKEFLLESKFPSGPMKAHGIDPETLKNKVYEIRCKHCGKTPQEVSGGK